MFLKNKSYFIYMNHSRSLVWLLIALCLLMSVNAETVKINGYINDYAGIITPDYSAKITPILKGLQDQKLAEFSIVTIKSLDGRDIEGYALELAQGVLGAKDKNNGLLLLVALDERQYRFEVGRGLEPDLPDSKIGTLGRTYLTPNFKNAEYGKGIYESVIAVQSILTNDTASNYYVQNDSTNSDLPIIIAIIISIIMFILYLVTSNPLYLIPLIIILLAIVFAIIRAMNGIKKNPDKYFNAAFLAVRLMSHSGRGGSGGFGGFGGGGFGGGGAGSNW